MYNLPNLQRQHPQLRQLNNWTGQHGGLFDGLEQRESNSSPKSFTDVTNFDLGDGRPAHLQGKALPPIVGTDIVKHIAKENISDDSTTTAPVFAKVSPLAPLPPLSAPKKDEDVINQASKHIQDYKNDVRRIDECLQIAKQQQADSLLEKMKERQQLKQAEMEEKKQRDALHTKIMRFDSRNKNRNNMEKEKNGQRKKKGVEERKKTRDENNEPQYDDVYDIKRDVINDDKYDVKNNKRAKGVINVAEYDDVYDIKRDVINDDKYDVKNNKKAKDVINEAEYVYDIKRDVINEVKYDVKIKKKAKSVINEAEYDDVINDVNNGINKETRDDINRAENGKVYKIVNGVKFGVSGNAKDAEHDKVRKIQKDFTNEVKHGKNEARHDSKPEEPAGNQYDYYTSSTTSLYRKEDPSQASTQCSDNHVLGQRQDSIQWIKVEGKRKKSLKKFIKFAVVFLVVIVFGILLIAIKKSRRITDEVTRNESIGETGSLGKQKGNISEEHGKEVKATSLSSPWSGVTTMGVTKSFIANLYSTTVQLKSTDGPAADKTIAASSRNSATSSLIVTSTEISSFTVTQGSMSRTTSPEPIPTSASLKQSTMSHTTVTQLLSTSVTQSKAMSRTPSPEPIPTSASLKHSAMPHTTVTQLLSTSVTQSKSMSRSSLMQQMPKPSSLSHTLSIQPVLSSVTQQSMKSRSPSIQETSIPIHHSSSSSTQQISTTVVYTTKPINGEHPVTAISVTSISHTMSLSLSATTLWTYEVDETVTDAEYVCSVTYTTTDVDALWRKIKRLSRKIHRMLLHRYYYYYLIREGHYRRRGEKLLEKVCDLIQHPGNGGMVLIDLQTMAQRLMDLLEITYSCI